MSNVLGELFSDIANAIREKTGETGTMKPAQFPEKISAIEVGSSNKNVILEKTTVESFALNSGFGLYMHQVSPPPFTLTVDETYTVLWDDVEYEVEALDVGFVMAGTVAMGNGTVFGIGSRDDVPFIIAQNNQCVYYIAVEDYDQPHTVCIYLKVSNEPVIVDGVDPYYQQLAEALMKRDAQYLSGDSRTMSMSGFVVSDGTTLASLQPYSFAGFKNVEGMEFSDVVLVQDNAFVGNSKMKILDITTADSTTFTNFFQNALDGCTSLEAVIIRGGASGLTTANINSVQKANDTFYIYVPAACYDAVISNITDGFLPASRYRRLEDYPAIDNWNKTFTVEFYDGDTLVDTKTVKYGGSASSGYTPEGYQLREWSPAPINVTADMKCYGTWIPEAFADASWEEIISVAESGNLSNYYRVGDEKPVTLSYSDGTTEDITFVIAGFGVCALYDGTYSSTLVDGVTLITKNALATKQYMDTSYRSGYYTNTDLAAYLTNTVYPAIPEELRNGIKQKALDFYSGWLKGLPANCWLLDFTEVGITGAVGLDPNATKFPVFSDNASRIKYLGSAATATDWWLRSDSMPVANSYNFGYVAADGSGAISAPNDAMRGVVFGICI